MSRGQGWVEREILAILRRNRRTRSADRGLRVWTIVARVYRTRVLYAAQRVAVQRGLGKLRRAGLVTSVYGGYGQAYFWQLAESRRPGHGPARKAVGSFAGGAR